MRVTRAIIKYVEERVNNIYSPLIASCEDEYYNKRDEIEKALEKMASELDIVAKKMIKENGFSLNPTWDGKSESQIIISTAAFGDEEFTLYCDKSRKLYDEKNQTIKEILESLELGKTKAELDEMLKTLQDSKGEVTV